MASNQSVLEQLLQTALSGGGLRDGQGTGGHSQSAPGGAGNLGDILGSLLGGGQMTAGGGATPSRAAPGGAGGLGDILGSILGGSETAGAGGAEYLSRRTGRVICRLAQQQAEMPQKSGMNDLVRYGGIEVIGALAYQALKRYPGAAGGRSAASVRAEGFGSSDGTAARQRLSSWPGARRRRRPLRSTCQGDGRRDAGGRDDRRGRATAPCWSP